MTRSKPFTDPALYEKLRGSATRSAAIVVPIVLDLMAPESVVDFGAGTGGWLAAFRDAGVQTIQGLEGGLPDPSQIAIEPANMQRVDFERPVDLGRRFDLAVTLEVAEHLPASSAALFVESIARHSDAVLFSAAIPEQGGDFHLNEQWPTYWADLFAAHRFECFDPFRDALWADERVEWWYRQNMLLFARGEVAVRLRATGLAAGRPRHLVHPGLYQWTLGRIGEERSIRDNVRGLARGLRRRVSR